MLRWIGWANRNSRVLRWVVAAALMTWSGSALAQPAGAVLWQCSTGTSGQPVYCPVSTAQPLPTTGGGGGGGSTGLSTFSEVAPATVISVAIKAGAGTLYGIDGFSIAATQPAWIKFYDATQPSLVCGTGTPKLRYMIPGQGVGGSGVIMHEPNGIGFATGITACVTTGIADADVGTPAAATYTFNATYK
jgi:hypothetical protein